MTQIGQDGIESGKDDPQMTPMGTG